MEEKDSVLWTELFQDKPIPKAALGTFQAKIMAEIATHPVDFGAEFGLAARRKWGLGLAISLIFSGLVLGILLWFGSDILYPSMNLLLVMLPESSYVAEFQQVGQRIIQGLIFLKDLKIEMDLLWGVVSWPLLGVLSVIVIFRNQNSIYDDPPIEK